MQQTRQEARGGERPARPRTSVEPNDHRQQSLETSQRRTLEDRLNGHETR
jgi:hypothetical protein